MKYLIVFFAGFLSVYIGEKLILGRLFQHIFRDNYYLYQLCFWLLLFIGMTVLKSSDKKSWMRAIQVLILSYVASFFSYHLAFLIGEGFEYWENLFNDHSILAFFTPACFPAIIVGSLFYICSEAGTKLYNLQKGRAT